MGFRARAPKNKRAACPPRRFVIFARGTSERDGRYIYRVVPVQCTRIRNAVTASRNYGATVCNSCSCGSVIPGFLPRSLRLARASCFVRSFPFLSRMRNGLYVPIIARWQADRSRGTHNHNGAVAKRPETRRRPFH